jgi:hypothetical protein
MVDRQFRQPDDPPFVRWLSSRRQQRRSQEWLQWWQARQQYEAQRQAAAVPAVAPQPAYVAPQVPYVAPQQAVPQAPVAMAAPAPQAAASMTFAPQAAAAPPAAQPYNANPYQPTIGDPAAAYAAFNRVRSGGDGGFAWDALRDSRGAQDELYLQNAAPSSAFSNWFRRNSGDFYNRYVADSAQTGGGDQQYTDWLARNNLGAEFLRQPGANRGYFEGLYNPAARVII